MARPQQNEDADARETVVDELPAGTKLMHGQYVIERFLNAGGFGITYLARDSLDRKIVIKECFPGAFCRRSRYIVQARSRAHQNELKSIVRLFVQEARNLAKLDHPNIVGVHQVFEDNDTAYMALDFVEGRDLMDTIEDPNNGLTPPQITLILRDMLGAVGFIHDQGILHRDISPDNILIDQDRRPVLIDFGAAREEATKQSRVLSAMRVVKDGYSPQEFYIAGSDQGPWSDLYALGASFFHLISGDAPPNSQARLAAIASGEADPYNPLAGRIDGYEPEFLAAIDKALSVLPKGRLQSARDWLAMMEKGAPAAQEPSVVVAPVKPARKSRMPLLLGTAAGIAALAGAGVLFLGQGDSAGVTTPAQIAAEQVTAVAPAPVGVAIAPPVATETDVAVAAPDVDVVAPDPVPVPDVAVATPEPVPVAEPAVLDPVVIAAVLMPAALPVPGAPRDLPAITDMRLIADVSGAGLVLPDVPAAVADAALGAVGPISPVAPGADLTVAGLSLARSAVLPFAAADGRANVIGAVDAGAPDWARLGLEITSVNAVPVDSIDRAAVQAGRIGAQVAATGMADVTIGTRDPATGTDAAFTLVVPVVETVTLANGVAFDVRLIDGVWRSTVVAVPDPRQGGLQLNDVVTSFIPTAETVDARDSLTQIFNREIPNGTQSFTFAVQRGGSLWVASLPYTGE